MGGEKHRWKNYLPDTGNSFCYMNPDICYTIKGTQARGGGGGRKEKLEEEEILHELAFHLLSRDGVSGEQCLLWQGQDGARASTPSTLFPNVFTKEWRVLFCKEAAFLFAGSSSNYTLCFSVESLAPAQLGVKKRIDSRLCWEPGRCSAHADPRKSLNRRIIE